MIKWDKHHILLPLLLIRIVCFYVFVQKRNNLILFIRKHISRILHFVNVNNKHFSLFFTNTGCGSETGNCNNAIILKIFIIKTKKLLHPEVFKCSIHLWKITWTPLPRIYSSNFGRKFFIRRHICEEIMSLSFPQF